MRMAVIWLYVVMLRHKKNSLPVRQSGREGKLRVGAVQESGLTLFGQQVLQAGRSGRAAAGLTRRVPTALAVCRR